MVRNDIYFYATEKDTALLQLAIGLVEDLKLTRPQKTTDLSFKSIVEDAAHLRDDLPVQPKQTRADRRTLLGVYYITSSYVLTLSTL